jgi:hypothetical protein
MFLGRTMPAALKSRLMVVGVGVRKSRSRRLADGDLLQSVEVAQVCHLM